MSNGKVLTFRIPVTLPTPEASNIGRESDISLRSAVQQNLFPSPNVMVVFRVANETGAYISEVLHTVQPACVLDLRPIPRFDYGTLDRSRAFAEFEKSKSIYLEASSDEVRVWTNQLESFLVSKARRPILVLINDSCRALEGKLTSLLSNHRQWSLKRIETTSDAQVISQAAG